MLCSHALREPLSRYPEGREMMLIGSDITLKAGSFGTIEDEVFCQASQIARARGIPRIYIACNSGHH